MNESTNKIINRLHRIEGQIRGVENMIREKKTVPLTIQQLEAVRSATAQVINLLIEESILTDGHSLTEDEIITLKRIIKKN